jgi:hypothetical protein
MIPSFENTDKIIICDWSVFLHKAIFALKFNPSIPATYTALSMILGTLARVGISPDSTILMVRDGRDSWRKKIESAYKGNRKAHREESGLDWDYWFQKFDELADKLDKQTNWIFVGPIEHIEADDIAAVACRYYKDVPEIVLVTIDSDWEQMWSIHPGVKIFSLQTKEWKIRPDDYNIYEELAKKIKKEASDNLVTEVTNTEEYDKRLMCIDLTRLPEWVEKTVIDVLSNPRLYNKNVYPEIMPSVSLQERFDNLYNDKSKLIDYNEYVTKKLKKEERKKQKKIEAKEKIKRQKECEKNKIKKLEQENLKLQRKLLKKNKTIGE